MVFRMYLTVESIPSANHLFTFLAVLLFAFLNAPQNSCASDDNEDINIAPYETSRAATEYCNLEMRADLW